MIVSDLFFDINISKSLLVYLGSVFAGGLILLWIIRRSLRSIENRGTNFIQRLKVFEPIKTKKPKTKQPKSQRAKALQSFSSRFTIVKRIILISYLIIWFIIFVFPFFGGIPATVVSVLAAVLAAVVGIAARPFLENLIAGVVITFSRQFKTGDTVLIDQEYGTVEDITITHSIVKLWNWKRLIIPNSRMLNKEMVSYTTKDSYIWAHVEFWVSYETDIELVEKLSLEIANNCEYKHGESGVKFWIMEMAKEGIKCWVTLWTNSPTNSWYAKIQVRSNLIKEMKKHGIKTHGIQYNKTNVE
jgi:small-conductance mechanosensitive channel